MTGLLSLINRNRDGLDWRLRRIRQMKVEGPAAAARQEQGGETERESALGGLRHDGTQYSEPQGPGELLPSWLKLSNNGTRSNLKRTRQLE